MKLSISILIVSCIVAFVCFMSCNRESQNPVNKSFDVTGFNKIMAGDDHEIIVTTGTSFSVQARGEKSDLEDVRMVVSNGTLKISYPYYDNNRKRLHIFITMPQLIAAEFSGSSFGSITGFQQQVNFSINLTGSSKFSVTNNAPLIDADISGTSVLTLNGMAGSIIANVSGQSTYNGYGLVDTDNAIIKSTGHSHVYVNVNKAFTVNATGQSKIYYKGNPETKNLTIGDMSELVKQ